jgi:uncharacterized protein (DUF488 family)
MTQTGRTPTIRTIGYERLGFAAFIEAMQDAGIETVIDVRDLPNSRRAGFSKGNLKAGLARVGIDYVHLKALGTPKSGRDANKRGDWENFWPIVDEALSSPEAGLALEQAAIIAKTKHACLLWLEHDWRVCHRLRVCELLSEKHGFVAEHIGI